MYLFYNSCYLIVCYDQQLIVLVYSSG